jgi:ketosteroid isomerase-like protein
MGGPALAGPLRVYTGAQETPMKPAGTVSQDVNLIRRAFELFDEGGMAAAAELFDPEIEWRTTGLISQGATYHGVHDVLAYGRKFDSAFEGLHFKPLEFIERGDAVIVPTKLSARGAHGGGKVEVVLTYACWVRDGRIRRVRSFRSREAALREINAP